MKKTIIAIFILVISIATLSYAHSGRTDGYGGHYNRSTGTYHYHSGKYAHTGEYTAPIEQGGHLIEEKQTQNTTTNKNTSSQNTTSNTSELEKRIIVKDKRIQELKNDIVYKEKKIKDLENEKTSLWWTFGLAFFIGICISYNVGKNNK